MYEVQSLYTYILSCTMPMSLLDDGSHCHFNVIIHFLAQCGI